MNIEPLEPRIAPAILVNPTTVTYIDTDGDAVTVKISKGVFEGTIGGAPGAGDFTFLASGIGEQLQLINLSNDAGEFARATLKITATRGPASGDGFVNVGYINSTSFDLGAVTVDGDLGQIDAGDPTTATAGLAGLTVQSMGRYDLTTQGGGASLDSNITGKFPMLRVRGDLMGTIVVTGGADGDLGSATIAGSLIGGVTAGEITASGDIGKVTIGGDLVGGGRILPGPGPGFPPIDEPSGFVFAGAKLTSISVKGSVIGSSVPGSGGIAAGTAGIGSVKIGGHLVGGSVSNTGVISAIVLGAVTIGGDIVGGSGVGTDSGGTGFFSLTSTGIVSASTSITSVTVGGSIRGGSPEGGADNFAFSGGISCGGVIGKISLRGNLEGGDATGALPLIGSGFIQAGRLPSVTIGGSVISGTDSTTGGFERSGSIGAADDIGTLTVKGSLIGNSTHPVIITAEGAPVPTSTTDVAMKTITIAGRVELAEILAGYNTSRMPVNANAQIGSVTAGSWIASDLVAGCEDTGDGFGNSNDNQIGGAAAGTNPISRIASITIKGQVIGTSGPGDRFGFVAEHIVSLRVGGTVFPLDAGPNNIGDFDLIGTTGDVRVVEVL